MRCVVMGGAGFLGRHVGRALAAAGHEVWSVDRQAIPAQDDAHWLAGQVLAGYANLDEWWNRCGDADVLVHLASSTVPATASQDPVEDAQLNLIGMLRLLGGLRERKWRPRLLFASSGGAVYGRPESVPLSESHPTMPMGAYGVTKLAIEHHLRIEEAQHGLPYRVLRLSNPFGQWQRPHGVQGVIPVFAHHALNDEPVEVWGDGSVVRDFVHAADVGAAFAAALEHEGPSRTFNIGAGRGLSVNQIIAALEHLLGRPVRRRSLPGRAFDPPVNVLDIGLARYELGWSPKVPFEAGLAEVVQWLKGQP